MGNDTNSPQAGSIVVWDTEYTCWKDSRQNRYMGIGHHREVFQYAALLLTRNQPWQEAPTLNVLAKTVLNPLSDYAQELTGITQERLEREGVSTAEALARLAAFAGSHMLYSNGNDINPVAETCGLQKVVMPLNPLRARTLRQALYTALKQEVGEFDIADYPSGNVYKLLNLSLQQGHTHEGGHDVRSLAATIQELERRGHNLGIWDEGEDKAQRR